MFSCNNTIINETLNNNDLSLITTPLMIDYTFETIQKLLQNVCSRPSSIFFIHSNGIMTTVSSNEAVTEEEVI